MSSPPLRPATRGQIVAAFAAVYVIWGSTYLAIRFAIQTLPTFVMAGARFIVAGAIIYAWHRASAPRGELHPSASQWRWATLAGALLLLGGNGAVVWAERTVPSGVVALLVSGVPIWMVLLDWWRPGGRRPSAAVVVGIAVGAVGMALLVGPGAADGGDVPIAGALTVLGGGLAWAVGSQVSKSPHMPRAVLLSTAMQMLTGGALLLVVGLLIGEGAHFDVSAVTRRSAIAWLYLVGFGSIVGYTAYIWLLDNVSSARASTYAYVNPVVAVALGWALAGEVVTSRTLVAAAVIVAAVAIIVTARKPATQPIAAGDQTPLPARAARREDRLLATDER